MLAVLITGARVFGIDEHGSFPANNKTYTSFAYHMVKRVFKKSVVLPSVVIHGDAHGADTLADCVGKELGCEVEAYPYLSEYGKAGGAIRNAQMLARLQDYKEQGHSIQVWAFHEALTSKGGTGNMVRLATSAGVTTFWFQPTNIEEGIWQGPQFKVQRPVKM